MLEKAKNRKIFYFLVFIILGLSLYIPSVFAADTVVEFSTIQKGYIKYYDSASGHTWKCVHGEDCSATHIYTNDNPNLQIYQHNTNQFAGISRAFLSFNTASLPDDANIKSVFLYAQFSSGGYTYTTQYTIDVVSFNPAIKTSVALGDYNSFGNTADYSYNRTIADEGYHYLQIPESYINVTGTSLIGLRYSADTTNTAPTDTGNIAMSCTLLYPKLIITYGDEEVDPRNAIIEASPINGELPLQVTFTDNSTGFSEEDPYPDYIIYFGDGESFTGERQYTGENWFHEYDNEGVYNITYLVIDNGETFSDSTTITVSDTSTNYQVQVHGLNTAVISGANVSIWYNGEYQDSEGTSVSGISYFDVPPYRFVNGTVTKPGYQTAYFDTYIYPEDNLEFVTLYLDNETAGSGDSYGNYIVTFRNAVTGQEVGYSNIEVYSDSGYTTLFYDEYSNSVGIWTGLLPMNTTYYYKYPETTSYYSQIWSYNLTSSPAYKTVNLIPKSGATSTTTPTPTITTTTITPTVTYTYNDSNLSTLNVKERFTNLLVLAGFQNAESADLIFAMIIVLGCTVLIGWITLSGSGAGMGAIIGFVFSLGLGLIPLWLLIAAIFFACLYVALKLFGGSGE